LPPLGALAAFVLLWQGYVSIKSQPAWLLPGPFLTLQTFWLKRGLLLENAAVTFYEAFLGLILAVLLAVLLAFLLTALPKLGQGVYPLLVASQVVPIIVLAPLFLIWFGYGLLPKILVVILICFFPIVINFFAGLNAFDASALAFYRHMGASPLRLFFKVRLPGALPYFFGGLRVAAAYSVMGAVIGEWQAAEKGLGRLITVAQDAYNAALVFAAILAIALLSGAIFGLVWLAERHFLRWRRVGGGGPPET